MPSRRAAVLGGTALALVLASTAAGTAWAAGPSSTPSTGSPAGAATPATGAGKTGARTRSGGPLMGLEHGTLVVRRGGADRTVALQRGTVTAVSATSLTVVSRDAFSGTYALTSTTKVRTVSPTGGSAATAAALHVGDRVGLRAVAGNATLVRDRGK